MLSTVFTFIPVFFYCINVFIAGLLHLFFFVIGLIWSNLTWSSDVSMTCFQDQDFFVKTRGIDPYGTGDTSPTIFGLGDIITNAPFNISRVISATFYPCNIFLIR